MDFPTTLPKPLAPGYGISPEPQTIRTEMEIGSPRVRRRSASKSDSVSVSWLFNSSQMLIFRAWFDSPSYAAGGAAWFNLDLYSGDGGIRSRECRFLEQWDGQLVRPDTWHVTAKIETRGGELTADEVRGAIEGLMVGNVYPTLVLEFAIDKTLDSRITFTRASTATYYDASGVMQTAAANAARFDHDPVTGESLGLLIEEARTNLVLNSATLVTQNVTVAAVAHTLTFFGTGTVTLSGVSTSGPLVGTGASDRVSLTFTPTAGTLTLTVTGSVTLAQLEVGSFATSYIPTTSTAVTRAADAASMTGANFSGWYNASAGTMFAELALSYVESAGAQCTVSVNDGGPAEQMFLYASPSTASTHFAVVDGGATQADIDGGGAPSSGSMYKTAAAYAVNDLAASAMGLPSVTDLLATIPAPTALTIGRAAGSLYPINGHIKRILYYPARLSNAQLQVLTA